MPDVKFFILFCASLFLNLFFFSYHFLSTPLPPPRRPRPPGGGLTWTRRAAEEAEAVAAVSCSGHGRAYIDGVSARGHPVCECNTCYAGADCSLLKSNCAADADSGDPLFLEPYWMRHSAKSAVVVSGWHRMSYLTNNGFISVELERHIRALHRAVGNAVEEDKFIVFGSGCTQLINALVYALSPDNATTPASVVATAPYYPLYKAQTNLFDGREYEWKGITSKWINSSVVSTKNFIEFVTSPNNPDGLLHKSVMGVKSVIYDHAYYWPHFSAIPAPADEDVMLFSGSKTSGHASSRWALIKDEKVYDKVVQYMKVNTMGVSRDTQLRVLKLIKVILGEMGGGGDIFEFGYKALKNRWRKLNEIVSWSNRFSLQQIDPQYCTYFSKMRDPSPAAEAEAVAALACSGHGRAFVDGIIVHGFPTCECNACYAGPDCADLIPDCAADADSGDPLFLEPYWRRHAAGSTIVVSGWHRMSYRTTNGYISVELERHIRALHRAVGNAVEEDKFIVFGSGSTQLINALVYALSPDNATSPASVVATAPYYALYKSQTNLFDGREYEWKGITSEWINSSSVSTTNLIEFVTSPNNPDGLLHKSVLGGQSVIYDHAYYWPHFSAIPAPADEDVMLFSGSKTSGHASSRFGWALIKDQKVYEKVVQYMQVNTMGVSRDTQLRVLQLIKVILAEMEGKGDIFEFGYKTLKDRWRKLNEVVSSSNRFSLQQISPQYCTYFQKMRDPSPAYAWVKCEFEEDEDCAEVLKEAGIISRSGTIFEASSGYTRLSLIKTQDDFDLLLQKMVALVSKGGVSSI
ncbi:Tryptophan aminotransferase-related protein 4 [Ananas comosus]|uniref:Tryptophan aminotransferase-related protein 4 n=1 Tax=Ananas comosus TaxID=4615 RepID=A0A199W6Q6_ANACO|nr:Tryptophan aminotransferase-related protein 4 [Ananas comosus]